MYVRPVINEWPKIDQSFKVTLAPAYLSKNSNSTTLLDSEIQEVSENQTCPKSEWTPFWNFDTFLPNLSKIHQT